jgi:hypothetical protein
VVSPPKVRHAAMQSAYGGATLSPGYSADILEQQLAWVQNSSLRAQ